MDERNGLELRTPVWMSAGAADVTLRDNADWVRQALAALAAKAVLKPRMADGTMLPLMDSEIRLCLHFGHKTRAVLKGGKLVVSGEHLDDAKIRATVEQWYKEAAKCRLARRLDYWGERTQLRHTGVTIRAQRSCWGSCTAWGKLSLNWRLLLLPEVLVDYVLVHELCHLKHLDHSAAFWALVASHMPDYRSRMERLDRIQRADLPL